MNSMRHNRDMKAENNVEYFHVDGSLGQIQTFTFDVQQISFF